MLLFDFPLRNQIPLSLCELERSGRDEKILNIEHRMGNADRVYTDLKCSNATPRKELLHRGQSR
jgi:hypothetical protein